MEIKNDNSSNMHHNDSVNIFNPDLYVEANGFQRRDAESVLNEFVHMVHWRPAGDDVVLDVGCGVGDVTWDLLKPRSPSTARIVGTDVSLKMIRYAKKRYHELEFALLDIGSKELPVEFVGTFHHIFSFYCLHWVMDQRQAMENLFSLLQPGGDILMTYLASNPIYDVYLSMSKIPKWKPYLHDVFKYISPYHHVKDVEGTLRKLLRNVGFKVTVCECKNRTYEFTNLETVQKAMVAVNPFIPELPDHLKSQFVSDYVIELGRMKIIEENNNIKGEKISFNYRLIIIVASKPEQ